MQMFLFNADYACFSKSQVNCGPSGNITQSIIYSGCTYHQVLPKIPGQMAINMFVSSAEEAFMRIPQVAPKMYREECGFQNSDGIEEMKQERATTLSIVEPLGRREKR